MSQFALILLAFAFVLLNGFFVVAEFALVKLRQTQVQTLKTARSWRGRILAKVHTQLDAYLSACQLGITLASLGLGWIGEPAFAHLFQPLLHIFGVTSANVIEVVAFTAAFSIISFLHIVAGELMPKTLAIRRAEFWALWTAAPLYGFYWLMYPAIWLLNASANTMLSLFRLNAFHPGEQAYSTEELKLILKSSHNHGELSQIEADMLEHTLEFADLKIADVMRPVDEMIALNIDASIKDNLQIIKDTRYTRYPVYLIQPNRVIGILHIKDLFAASQQSDQLHSLKPLLRPVLKVKPDSLALDLFQQFQQGTPHFALAYHRGRVVGFVTLDNLLQVLLGRMKDEFHLTREDGKVLKDGSFIVKGNASIYTLEQLLDQDLSDYQAATVSGLILQQLQRFPQEGDTLELPSCKLTVEKIHGQRILQVHVYRKI
jgi:CBS domain containing-hemolysin-like protein